MKVGLYLGDAICGAAQLLMRGSEKKSWAEKKKKTVIAVWNSSDEER